MSQVIPAPDWLDSGYIQIERVSTVAWQEKVWNIEDNNDDGLKSRSQSQFQNVGCIIFPDDDFYGYWREVIIIILIYTAVITPYMVWFVDNKSDPIYYIDLIIDGLFFIDIIVTCCLAYYNADIDLVTDKKKIFYRYLTSWMILDIFACIPFHLVLEQRKAYNALVRLARIPRLIRLTKLSKLARFAKILQHKISFRFTLTNFFHLSPAILRLCKFVFLFVLLCHLIACFWGLVGVSYAPENESWIFVYGYMEQTPIELYFICLYWSVTTLTTVGYGDISPQNPMERGYANLVMIAGIFIYSYVIGSVANVLQNLDHDTKELNQKYEVVNEMAKKYHISRELYRKIINALDFEHKNRNKAFEEVLDHLPHSLKNELMTIAYSKLIEGNKFFDNKTVDFIGCIVPKLKFYRFDQDDYIYKRSESATEMYFVIKGEVGLAVKSDLGQIINYHIISAGKHFGEVDMLLNPQHIHTDFARAMSNCQILAIMHEELIDVFGNFEEEYDQFWDLALYHQDKYRHEARRKLQLSKKTTHHIRNKKVNIVDQVKTNAFGLLGRKWIKNSHNDSSVQAQIRDLNIAVEKIEDKQNRMEKMMEKIYSKVVGECPSTLIFEPSNYDSDESSSNTPVSSTPSSPKSQNEAIPTIVKLPIYVENECRASVENECAVDNRSNTEQSFDVTWDRELSYEDTLKTF